jgi:hypothetical protein
MLTDPESLGVSPRSALMLSAHPQVQLLLFSSYDFARKMRLLEIFTNIAEVDIFYFV